MQSVCLGCILQVSLSEAFTLFWPSEPLKLCLTSLFFLHLMSNRHRVTNLRNILLEYLEASPVFEYAHNTDKQSSIV